MAELQAPRGTDQDTLTQLINQWGKKKPRNDLRTIYYEGKNALRDLGISLPPSMRTIDVVLGWPAKAVNALSARCQFDGYVLSSGSEDTFDIAGLMSEAGAAITYQQAITASQVHSTSFLTITPGADGEPPVLILPRSARSATGIWDQRTRTLTDGLSVTKFDAELGLPTELVWYSREHVTTFRRTSGGQWESDSQTNRLGRVWMEPLIFRPEPERPFGHSRISRGVMSLTDAGLRVLARSEAHAEFFASPQRYALGAEKEAFGNGSDRWNAVMSRLLTISKDEDGDMPTVGQFPQMSMQPHFDHLRALAALFAGETSIPLGSLGIVQDNPSSAEAIYAAKEDLVIEANAAMRVYGEALQRVAVTAVMMRDNLTEVPRELAGVRTRWRNAATPSVVSSSDAVSKQVAALPWLAESEVVLEELGFTEEQIIRLRADKRRLSGSTVLDRLREASANGTGNPSV